MTTSGTEFTALCETVLAEVEPPYKLVALLLYGCGLRLAEWRDMICRRSSDSWVMAM